MQLEITQKHQLGRQRATGGALVQKSSLIDVMRPWRRAAVSFTHRVRERERERGRENRNLV